MPSLRLVTMHAFIAGGSGQTGGHVIDFLVKQGMQIPKALLPRS